MKSPMLSVIIPTYKRSENLQRAIDSVYSQNSTLTFEIIVVDDNNDGDEFREKNEIVLKKYLDKENFIYLKHHTNLNGANARNTGLKKQKVCLLLF